MGFVESQLWKPSSTLGSNVRRSSTWLVWLFLIAFFPIEASLNLLGLNRHVLLLVAHLNVAASLTYFFFLVVFIVALTPPDFRPNPQRLFVDSLTSVAFNVVAFSLIYRFYGLRLPAEDKIASNWDHLYFSAVTFSTLGFGDFTPEPNSRILASFEAILGNIHLGILVGAAFLAINASSSQPLRIELTPKVRPNEQPKSRYQQLHQRHLRRRRHLKSKKR